MHLTQWDSALRMILVLLLVGGWYEYLNAFVRLAAEKAKSNNPHPIPTHLYLPNNIHLKQIK